MAGKLGTGRELFFFHNTLACLVKSLEGHPTTIDLRDDCSVTGTIEAVDGFMNLTLTNAVFCNARGDEYLFESFYIQARNIRYVHVPEQMPIVPTIKQYIGTLRGRRDLSVRDQERKNVQQSRKTTKAMRQHLEVVASLVKDEVKEEPQ